MVKALSKKAAKKAAKIMNQKIRRNTQLQQSKVLQRKTVFQLAECNIVPNVVIICPVRDRDYDKSAILKVYADLIKVKLVFVCQNWDKPWNKGAMINIAFLEISKLYPNDYRDINFVFHDVDVLPYTHIPRRQYPRLFSTVEGVIIQNCPGFAGGFALNHVFTILGKDYEKLHGFCNVYGWDNSDVLFCSAAQNANMAIQQSPDSKPIFINSEVPFEDAVTYRVYLQSEYVRTNKQLDNLESIKDKYTVDHVKNEIRVTSFETVTKIDLRISNILVCSKQPLTKNQLPKLKKSTKNVLKDGWYITQYDPTVHRKIVDVDK